MNFRVSKIIGLLLVMVFTTCQTNKKQYTSKPSRSIVNPDSDLLEVNAVAFHVNDSETTIYLEVINENLVYRRPDTTSAFYSELKISYRLLAEQGSRQIIDSSSYTLLDRAGESVMIESIRSQFNIAAKYGNNYYLDIQVVDVNKKTKYSKGINIYKLNNFNKQNYLVKNKNEIAFKNHFLKDNEIAISTANKGITKVIVDCFFKDFPIAAPPFSLKSPDELKYKPDSTFLLDLVGSAFHLTMPEKGFYHIRANAVNNEGLTVYTYDKTFPGVSDSKEMIECTRFLMNKQEFEDCKTAPDKKDCIDNFWITVGGSNERAKELLKRYYGRVKEANKYYTSYTQGWKTDRGMIFVVFGPPTNLYTNTKGEVWVYGAETNMNAVRFNFNKTGNPFSDNDYILERSQFFKDPWYTAVDYWRQGHVYLDNGK
ncbi:MAG: GWxTD domain-containing protein [Bacteroidetes bacterium]|nr:GWxTD domain-containing protein [Bacteroidota bacterium]